MLVEFARAGLSDPMLIRLDVDWKLPDTLWLGWLAVRAELKTAALLILLDKVLTPQTPQAVVFAATKHHVEYLHLVRLTTTVILFIIASSRLCMPFTKKSTVQSGCPQHLCTTNLLP